MAWTLELFLVGVDIGVDIVVVFRVREHWCGHCSCC